MLPDKSLLTGQKLYEYAKIVKFKYENFFNFTISDPPGAPQIQGLDENEVLIAGSLKRITCTSISGNPLATLKWFNGDKELVSIYLTRDNYASAEVAFVPKGQDNGGQLRCEATNMASMQPLIATRNLSVDFAPEFVKISVRPERPRAGHNVTLVCETDSSYPTSTITWWTNGEQLEGATEMIVDGDHGGFVTSSHLQLRMTPEHHGVVITCDASNGIMNQRAHDAITLAVARKYLSMPKISFKLICFDIFQYLLISFDIFRYHSISFNIFCF